MNKMEAVPPADRQGAQATQAQPLDHNIRPNIFLRSSGFADIDPR